MFSEYLIILMAALMMRGQYHTPRTEAEVAFNIYCT
jgi:hypothetical protein